MTSNFDENMTPVEMRELLYEFRKEYRILDSKVNLMSRERITQDERIVEMKQIINNTQKQLTSTKTNYNKTLNRKLTFKERVGGKIINRI
jgi:hypothetical protein